MAIRRAISGTAVAEHILQCVSECVGGSDRANFINEVDNLLSLLQLLIMYQVASGYRYGTRKNIYFLFLPTALIQRRYAM